MPSNTTSSTQKRVPKPSAKAQAALEDMLPQPSGKRRPEDPDLVGGQSKKAKAGYEKARDQSRASPTVCSTDPLTHTTSSNMHEHTKDTGPAARSSSGNNESTVEEDPRNNNESEDDLHETPEEQLHRMMKDWISPIYAFFDPVPVIEEVNGRHSHVFKCSARGCKVKIRRFLDKKDACSTGNMRRHANKCWRCRLFRIWIARWLGKSISNNPPGPIWL
ncbi:hypothetical protein EV363DRAFT_1463993 [Boletus edulis]|nr:hypothetical protein EV363DRAFT_1463993 [Boletus edulis]